MIKGVVVQKTKDVLPRPPEPRIDADDEDLVADEDREVPQDIMVMREEATFKQITVWGHEALLSETEDPYLKGLQEWMHLAKAVSAVISVPVARLTLTDAFSRRFAIISKSNHQLQHDIRHGV